MPEVCMMPWMLGTTPRPLAALQLTLEILAAGSATQIFSQGSAVRTYFGISSLCFEPQAAIFEGLYL